MTRLVLFRNGRSALVENLQIETGGGVEAEFELTGEVAALLRADRRRARVVRDKTGRVTAVEAGGKTIRPRRRGNG